MPWRENKGVCQFKRILDGNKIFKKISTENALEYLASGTNFYGDRLTGSKSKLESLQESLTRIRVLRVFRGFFWGLLRKKSLGEILFKMLPTARNILGR